MSKIIINSQYNLPFNRKEIKMKELLRSSSVLTLFILGTSAISMLIPNDIPDVVSSINITNRIDAITIYYSDIPTTIPLEEYTYRAVLARMPRLLSENAVCALTMAERTCAYRLADENGDITVSSDDPRFRSYLTDEEISAIYGTDAEKAVAAAISAEQMTHDMIITYEGRPIMAVTHPSSYVTESAIDLLGDDIHYLSHKITDDTSALSKRIFTSAELYARISAEYPDCEEYSGTEILSATEYGTVLSVKICGIELTGSRLSEMLSLKSEMFTVNDHDDNAEFIVDGEGSHLGMSISGAEHMSQNGCSWEDIIACYYEGAEITSVN